MRPCALLFVQAGRRRQIGLFGRDGIVRGLWVIDHLVLRAEQKETMLAQVQDIAYQIDLVVCADFRVQGEVYKSRFIMR